MADSSKYRAIIVQQQKQLESLVQQSGVGPVRRVYTNIIDELTAKLKATPAQTYTHLTVTGMAAQARLAMATLVRHSAGVMGDAAFKVGMASARNMLHTAGELEDELGDAIVPMPTMEIGRLTGLVRGQATSVLRMHDSSMARYGAQLVGTFEQHMATGLAIGENTHALADRIEKVGDLRWHGAERIVRTELSYAYNATHKDVADEMADDMGGDMWTRWDEHVSDGGIAFDDRVGDDSLAMHGQVAPPGGVFTQPPTAPRGEQVGESLVGQTWKYPPNRPNDRAVLTPWRSSWGIPGWIWEGGARVPVTEAMADAHNRKHFGPPPEVTTDEDEEAQATTRAPEQPPEPSPLEELEDAEPEIPPMPPVPKFGKIWEARTQAHLDYASAMDDAANAAERRAITAQTDAPWSHLGTAELRSFYADHRRIERELAARKQWLEKYDAATIEREAAKKQALEKIDEAKRALAAPEPPPEIWEHKKNPKRVAAAKKAAQASVERRREIHSAVKSNLADELQTAWDKLGHKFMQENSVRIKGVKDPINAASKISEAFAETYGSGDATVMGNEGDKFFARQELEAKHAESWANEQERSYYEEAQRAAIEAGDIDESGELTEQGRARQEIDHETMAATPNPGDDDPPF